MFKPIDIEHIKLFKKLGECSICGYFHDKSIFENIKNVLDENDYLEYKQKTDRPVSLHIVYFNTFIKYEDLCKFRNNVFINEFEPLNNVVDKSIYTKNRLFGHVAFNKTKNKTSIRGLPNELFIKQFVQVFNSDAKLIDINMFSVNKKKHKRNK